MTVFSQIQQYANQDFQEAARLLASKYHVDSSIDKLTYNCDEDIETSEDASCIVTANMTVGNKHISQSTQYIIDNSDIYGGDVSEIVRSVLASCQISIDSSDILGAKPSEDTDPDLIDDLSDIEFDEDSLDQNIDDIADGIDSIQDQIDDIDPDEPNIDVDNNISNHYVAECDRCHGIFISAVIQSDQLVDSISGVCPLCEKDTTQRLKWVVKSVEDL